MNEPTIFTRSKAVHDSIESGHPRPLKVDAASLHRVIGWERAAEFGEQVGERVPIGPDDTWFHVPAVEDCVANLVLWADGEPVVAFPPKAYPRGSMATCYPFPLTLRFS